MGSWSSSGGGGSSDDNFAKAILEGMLMIMGSSDTSWGGKGGGKSKGYSKGGGKGKSKSKVKHDPIGDGMPIAPGKMRGECEYCLKGNCWKHAGRVEPYSYPPAKDQLKTDLAGVLPASEIEVEEFLAMHE